MCACACVRVLHCEKRNGIRRRRRRINEFQRNSNRMQQLLLLLVKVVFRVLMMYSSFVCVIGVIAQFDCCHRRSIVLNRKRIKSKREREREREEREIGNNTSNY